MYIRLLWYIFTCGRYERSTYHEKCERLSNVHYLSYIYSFSHSFVKVPPFIITPIFIYCIFSPTKTSFFSFIAFLFQNKTIHLIPSYLGLRTVVDRQTEFYISKPYWKYHIYIFCSLKITFILWMQKLGDQDMFAELWCWVRYLYSFQHRYTISIHPIHI